jgi:hypothetical protein
MAVVRICGLFLVVLSITGCFSPNYRDGNLRCAEGGAPCPDGYYCVVTQTGQRGTCWQNGHAPPRPAAPITASAGGAVNVTAAAAHGISISVGQPLVGSVRAEGDHTVQLGVMRGAVTK